MNSPLSNQTSVASPAVKPRLSVIIITKNEARHIEACIASVAFADEIIVLDNASIDNTAQLAGAAGAKVHTTTDWPGFGIQKNRALALASCDWVLSVDADERVNSELRQEIERCLALDDVWISAYEMPRLSQYCGQYMRHSGWHPDYVLRLFRRGTAQFSNDVVHESVQTEGRMGRLKTSLLHESFLNFESVLDKVNRYSTAGAISLQTKGRSASFGSAIGHGFWSFFKTYVLRLGFLDGKLGLALAISNAEGTYYRYLKLWLMQQSKNSD